MALADIFNPTFFLILGIVMLLLGLLVIYFETKLRDQNHKISSMVSLVSAMAEEIRGRKPNSNLNSIPMQNLNSMFPINGRMSGMNVGLIPVSDNEQEEDEEDDEDDDDDDDDDNDDDDEEDDDEEDDEEDEDNSQKTHFNIQKLSSNDSNEVINIGDEDKDKINLFYFKEKDEDYDENDLEDMEELDNLVNELEETNFDTDIIPIKDEENTFDFLKTIHISNLEEEDDNSKFDYKKYSLNKLRNLVVEKGLVTDSSKLKKHELLKLLGVE